MWIEIVPQLSNTNFLVCPNVRRNGSEQYEKPLATFKSLLFHTTVLYTTFTTSFSVHLFTEIVKWLLLAVICVFQQNGMFLKRAWPTIPSLWWLVLSMVDIRKLVPVESCCNVLVLFRVS